MLLPRICDFTLRGRIYSFPNHNLQCKKVYVAFSSFLFLNFPSEVKIWKINSKIHPTFWSEMNTAQSYLLKLVSNNISPMLWRTVYQQCCNYCCGARKKQSCKGGYRLTFLYTSPVTAVFSLSPRTRHMYMYRCSNRVWRQARRNMEKA